MRVLFFLFVLTAVYGCSKHIDYSQEYMDKTSGRYLYNDDEVIDIYYKNKKEEISRDSLHSVLLNP